MSDQRRNGISWTDETWNPLRGCSKVSPGCKNCYAETMAARFAGPGQPYEGTVERGRWNGQIRLVLEKLSEPLHWKRSRRIFVNSMSDLFHESVPFEYVAAVFGVMAACPQHTFQVLTKRPARAVEFFAWAQGNNLSHPETICLHYSRAYTAAPANGVYRWPLPNVWLGVSVEDHATADARIPLLLRCPAAVRFVSYEPALAAVDFTALNYMGHRLNAMDRTINGRLNAVTLDWVIVGGESGLNARPFDVAWARSVIAQCRAAGVPAFVKQLGAHPIANGDWMPEGWNGHVDRLGVPRYRDRAGADPAEWPEDLRVREWPAAKEGER